MYDLFHIAIAIGPIGVYLLLMAWIRMMNRPLVVSGGGDIGALALGLSGCVAVGPMELFFPRAFASVFGPNVWLMLGLLYVLCILLVVLASRPRLVVYGLSADELIDHLRSLCVELDATSAWLGDNLQAPALGVSAIVEKAGPGRISQIVAVSHRQDLRGWVMIEKALSRRLQSTRTETRSVGTLYLCAGTILMIASALALTHDPVATAESIQEMLRY